MSKFFEIQSVNFDITELEDDAILSDKYTKKILTTSKLPFQETYGQKFLYYNPELKNWVERNNQNANFEDKIIEELPLHPFGQGGGFIGFGGYNLSSLPRHGKQWENSKGFSVEQRVYLHTQFYNNDSYGNSDTWVYLDIENNRATDLTFGKLWANAFNITTDSNNKEIITFTGDILKDLKYFRDKLNNLEDFNDKSYIELDYNSFLSNDAKQFNIITELPEEPGIYLDIPNYINGQEVNGIDLTDKISVNQIIVPVNSYFILHKNQFEKADNFTTLQLIRSYVNEQYNLTNTNAEVIDNPIQLTNTFIIADKGLLSSATDNLSTLNDCYYQINYGNRGLSNSKIRNFNVESANVYPYNNINFAIENTPYLQHYLGSMSETSQNIDSGNTNHIIQGSSIDTYIDTGGILGCVTDSLTSTGTGNKAVKIKSISNAAVVSIIEATSNELETGNILRLSKLTEQLRNKYSKQQVNDYMIFDNALLSSIENIHTLVLDNIENLFLSTKALDLGANSKIRALIIDRQELPYYSYNKETPAITLTNNSTIICQQCVRYSNLLPIIDTEKCTKLRLWYYADSASQYVNKLYNLQELWYNDSYISSDGNIKGSGISFLGDYENPKSFKQFVNITIEGVYNNYYLYNTSVSNSILRDLKNIRKLDITNASFDLEQILGDSSTTIPIFSELEQLSTNFNLHLELYNSGCILNSLLELNWLIDPEAGIPISSTENDDVNYGSWLPSLKTLRITPNAYYKTKTLNAADIGSIKWLTTSSAVNGKYYTTEIVTENNYKNKYWREKYDYGTKWGATSEQVLFPTNQYYKSTKLNTRFKGLNNLRDLYIPEDFVKYNQLQEQAFYGSSPIDIYIYIAEDPEYLANKQLTLINYVNSHNWDNIENNNFVQNKNNIFPFNSKIYLYNVNATDSQYQTLLVGKYTSQRNRSKKIKDLQLFNYNEFEDWGDYINNETK